MVRNSLLARHTLSDRKADVLDGAEDSPALTAFGDDAQPHLARPSTLDTGHWRVSSICRSRFETAAPKKPQKPESDLSGGSAGPRRLWELPRNERNASEGND